MLFRSLIFRGIIAIILLMRFVIFVIGCIFRNSRIIFNIFVLCGYIFRFVRAFIVFDVVCYVFNPIILVLVYFIFSFLLVLIVLVDLLCLSSFFYVSFFFFVFVLSILRFLQNLFET